MKTSKARVFVFLTLVTLTAVFSANALTATATAATADTAITHESGFIASSFNNILSFFGFGEAKPAVDKADGRDSAKGCDTAPEGLLACYRGDLDASDVKGVHNGEWVGTYGFATGKVGTGAFSFNGSNRVEAPNAEDLNPTNVTVDGWVNLSNVDGTFNLISKGDAYSLSVRDGHVVFASRNAAGVVETFETSDSIKTGTWTHIAATHDGSLRVIYIDGKDAGSARQKGLFGADQGGLVIGATAAKEDGFIGLADEVKVFGRALSAKEIGEIAGNRPDAINNVTFSVTPTAVTEGDVGTQLITLQVVRDATNNGNAISINFTATGSGASPATGGVTCGPGVDYVLGTSSVSYIAGEIGTKSTTIAICGDLLAEATETFLAGATIVQPVGGNETLLPGAHTVTITDNDTVSLGTAPTDAPELTGGAGSVRTFTVNRGAVAGNPGPAFPVAFTLSGTSQSGGGTPTTAQDYTVSTTTVGCTLTFTPAVGAGARSGTIQFDANSTTQTCAVVITTVTDDFVENNESVTFTVNTAPGNPATQTFNITNDDNPFVSVAVSANQNDAGRQYVEEGTPQTGLAAGALTYTFTRGLCAAATPGDAGNTGPNFTCPGADASALVAGQDVNITFSGTARRSAGTPATDPVDYTPTGTQTYTDTTGLGSVRFNGITTSSSVMVDPNNDIVVENDETVIVTVNAGTGYNVDTTPAGADTATGFINDDDEDVSVAVTTTPTTEGGGPLTYTFTRTALSGGTALVGGIVPTSDIITVSFTLGGATTAATCTDTSDFTLSAGPGAGTVTQGSCVGSVMVAANQLTAVVLATPTNDTIPENQENVLLTIVANGTQYGVGFPNNAGGANPANASANGIIQNDDFQVIITGANSAATAEDGATNLVYTFTRIGANAGNIVANFNTSGSANPVTGPDFVLTGQTTYVPSVVGNSFGTITIPNGTTTQVNGIDADTALLTADPMMDTVVEPDENVLVQVDNGLGYAVGTPSQANGVILNDDAVVTVTVNPNAVLEDGATNLTFTFARTGGTGAALVVNYNLTGSGTLTNADFVNPPSLGANTVTIPAGSASANVIVDPVADIDVEADETVTLTPVANTGYTVGAPGSATGTITNDDTGLSVVITGSQGTNTAIEGNVLPATAPGALTATFTRTNSIGGLTVNFTVAGSGASPANQADFTGAIIGVNNQVVFAAGQTQATVTLVPVADNDVEPNDQLTITLQPGAGYVNPTGAGSSSDGVILNDDNDITCTAPTGGAAGSPTVVVEGNTLTFSCTRATNGVASASTLAIPFTFTSTARFSGGTAADPNDYTISGDASNVTATAGGFGATGTLTFAAGNSTAVILVNSTTDTVVEPDETVTVTYSANGTAATNQIGATTPGPQGYDLVGTTFTGTISNDDNTVAVGVSLTDPDAAGDTVFESGDRELRYTFSRVTNGTAATLPLSINFAISGTACRPTVVCPAGGQGVDSAGVDYAVIFPVGTTGTYDPATGLGTIVIPANVTSASFIADPVDDQTPELPTPESVVVTINAQNPVVSTSTYTITTASATGFIANDDTSFAVSATAVMGGGALEGNDNSTAPHGVVPENSGFAAPDDVTGLTPHGSHAVFTVTRTGDTSTTQRIDISTIPTGTIGAGSATSGLPNTPCGTPGVDYITDGRTLEFGPGVTTRRFFVAICGDLTFENNETINVQLTNPAPLPAAPFSVTVPVATATWIIINDDGAFGTPSQFFIRPTNVTVTEGATVNFQVCLYAANPSSATGGATLVTAGADIFFDDTIFDGTAISPGDYGASFTDPLNPLDDTVIPAGQSCSANIAAPTVDDNLFEGDETFFIQVSNVNAGVGNVNPIVPALGTNSYPAGGTVPAVTAANNPFPGRGRAIILDNEAQNTFTISDVAQAEGNGGDNATTFNHVLIKNGEAAINQLVCWVTENGNSALPGGGPNPAIGGPNATGLFDYTSITTPNCYQFVPNGPTNVNVPIVVNGDLFFENNDTYTVRLVTINGNPGGAAFLSNSSHANDPNYAGLGIGTIQNDDATPVVGIVNRPSALETDAAGNAGQFNIPVTFTLTGASAVATSLTYTVTTPGLNATGETGAGANVGPLPPTSPPAGFVACTGTIDLYAPSTGTSASPVSLSTTNANGTVTVNGSTTINLVGCGDLRPETNETFTVTITSATNALVAATSTACQTSTSACGTKSGFIIDNDVVGPFNFTDANGITNGDVALAEGSTVGGMTPFTFLVRYQGVPADYPITVTYETSDGTAQDGNPAGEDNDYIARNNVSGNPCVITFPAGSNAAQPCVIQVRQDSVQEVDETFSVLATRIDGTGINVIGNNATGAPIVFGPTYNTPANPAPPGTDLAALGTILNDDGSRVFSVNAVTRLEGTSNPFDPNTTTAFVHRVEAQGSTNLNSTFTYTITGRPTTGTAASQAAAPLQARGGSTCNTANDLGATGTDFINLVQPSNGTAAGTGITGGVGTTTGTITFGPTGAGTGNGFEFVDIIVPVCTDQVQEADELYQIVLTAGTNGSISTALGNGVGTIRNDDGVAYSLLTNPININEGNNPGTINASNATVTLVRTGNSSLPATVSYFTTDGSAVGGASCSNTPTMGNPDYISSGTQAAPTATAGYTAGQVGNLVVQIPVCGDTILEPTESFTVTFVIVEGGVTTTVVATVNILNDGDVTLPPTGAGFEGDIVDAVGGPGGDGFVLANDVSAIRQYILGNGAPVTNPNQFQRADVNLPCGNGQIDAGDVTVIRQMILGTVPNNTPACGPTVPGGAPTTDEARPDVVARIIRAVNTQTVAGATVVVPFQLDAIGDEVSAAFTINFNSAVFTYVSTAPGAGLPANSVVNVNATQAAQGRLGVLIDGTTAIPAGTRQILLVTFNVAPLPAGVAGTYPVTFSGVPVAQSTSNIGGTLLTTTYEPGNIVISPSAAGVSVSGRVTTPNGQGLRNATVVLTDSEGNRKTATTGSFGIYTFDDVEAGQSYVVSVATKRFRFTSRIVNVVDSLADVDFVGQE